MNQRKTTGGRGSKACAGTGSFCGGGTRSAYLAALLAVGIWGSQAARGQSQAVDPVNVSGEGTSVPSASTPQVGNSAPAAGPAAAMPAEHSVPPAQATGESTAASVPPGAVAQANGGAASQGIVPIDVGSGGGAASAPASVPNVQLPTPPAAAPPAVPVPTAVAPPAAPAPAPAEPAAATPAVPSAPAAPGAPGTSPASSTAVATAPVNPNQVLASDGKDYPITGLKVSYYNPPEPGQPPINDLMDTELKLGVVDGAYVSPRPGVQLVTVKLGDIGKSGPQKIYQSAIGAIFGRIVGYINSRGIIGVFVNTDANDIDTGGNDLRPSDRTTLQVIVVLSTVKQVRTVQIGANSSDAKRVNDASHAFIRNDSPLQPAGTAAGSASKDLLRKDSLDDYVLRLNRYPGRRVDVAVSGTTQPGGVILDYLISENKPWYAYFQASNTGTKETDAWRERFGFTENNLTGHDDILSLDYMTAGFSASHAFIGSYELPFFRYDILRYKVYGSWNEYTASDVGQQKEQFTGNQWTVGNELTGNIYQNRELFVDALGGFRWSGQTTDNITTETNGNATYFEPYIGLRMNRSTDLATTLGSVTLVGYTTKASEANIAALGRSDPTRDPVVLEFDFAQSAYLEPLLDPGEFSSGKSTLANELYFELRGQYAFHDRLFPQIEDVAGGLYSVRGYPESIVAGDSVLLASAEYRLHVPRLFKVQDDPSKTPFLWDKSFRFSPQQAYGKPDWDLILRSFVDAGEVVNSNRQQFEQDASLVGAGVGVELQLKQNFNVRVDWGDALTDIPGEVKAGSSRFHISTTILY